jgi:hypothetical protein
MPVVPPDPIAATEGSTFRYIWEGAKGLSSQFYKWATTGRWWLKLPFWSLPLVAGFKGMTSSEFAKEVQTYSGTNAPGSLNFFQRALSSCEGAGWFCTDGDAQEWLVSYQMALKDELNIIKKFAEASTGEPEEDGPELILTRAFQESRADFEDRYPNPATWGNGRWTWTDDILTAIIYSADGMQKSMERQEQWKRIAASRGIYLAGVDMSKYRDEIPDKPPKGSPGAGDIGVGAVLGLGLIAMFMAGQKSSKKKTIPV